MPIDYKRYPANWKEISLRIRERDGQRCKSCHVPNGALRNTITGEWTRNLMQAETWHLVDGDKVTKIVLTVAHLGTAHADGRPGDKHDKHDVRDENLAALCQKCHLALDRDDHIRNAKTTRARKRGLGMMELCLA